MSNGATIQLQIGSVSFPLEVNAQSPPSAQTVDTIAALLKLGSFFHSPSGFEPLTLQVSVFQNWLQTNGYSIPDALNTFLGSSIDINHIGISANGSFGFNFSVVFDPPLGSGVTGGVIDFKDIGLSIARTKL